jgi:hypothetical protein
MPLPYLLVIIVAGIVGWAFLFRTQRSASFPSGERLVWLGASAVVTAIAATRVCPASELSPTLIGLVGGAAVSVVVAATGGTLPALLLAAVAATAAHLLPDVAPSQLGLVLGAGLGALTLAVESTATYAFLVTLAVAADRLGLRNNDGAGYAVLGSLLSLILGLGIVVAFGLPARFTAFRPFVTAIVIALGGAGLSRYVGEEALVVAVRMGAVVGLVLHFLIDEDEPDSLRIGLATILSIGLATVAFAAARGLGMSLALLAAVGVLSVTSHRRALLALGPLVGLVLYRVLREEGTGATRALDIGQHYTLLALALGAIVPLMFADWRGKSVGLALWATLGLAIPPLVIVMFGARGAVGFIVGLGLAATVDALRNAKDLTVYAVAAIMAPITLVTLHWTKDVDTLTRDQKIPLLLVAGTVIVVLSVALGDLGEAKTKEVAS